MAPSTLNPHPDAQPYALNALSEAQHEAIRRVLRAVDGLLTLPHGPTPDGKSMLERVVAWGMPREQRPSNVVLIEGERGSGKTSALLTLLAWLGQALGGEQPGELIASQDLKEAVGRLGGRVVPLRLIDLRPLPKETNLLVWLASQLDYLISLLERPKEAVPGSRDEPGPNPWEPGYEEELGSRAAWRQLIAAAAQGWDGQQGLRAGRLDPQAFAYELQQRERSRLEVEACWSAYVDALLTDLSQRLPPLGADPLLLLPLDDADMSPELCAQLLQLLPILRHPRVLLVVTGHEELLLTMLRKHFVQALGVSAKGILTEQARALSIAYLDKIVPPTNRFRLLPLSLDERKDHLAQLLDFKVQHPVTPPGHTPRFATLEEYFNASPLLGEGLPDNLREVQTTLAMQRSCPAKSATEILRFLWRRAVHSSADTSAIKEGLLPLADLYGEGRLVGLPRRTKELQVTPEWDLFSTQLSGLRVQTLRGYEVSISQQEYSGRMTEIVLDGRATGLALALLDISSELWGEPYLSPWSADAGRRAKLVLSYPALDLGEECSFNWPLPDHGTSTDYFLFSQDFRERLETDWNGDSASQLATHFLSNCISSFLAITGAAKEPPSQPLSRAAIIEISPDDNTEPSNGAVENLAVVLGELAVGQAEQGRKSAIKEWAMTGAPLLAAPEAGLPAEKANALLEGWLRGAREQERWQPLDQARSRLLQVRSERLQVAVRRIKKAHADLPRTTDKYKQVDALTEDELRMLLDKQFPDHKWSNLLGEAHSVEMLRTQVAALLELISSSPPWDSPLRSISLASMLRHYGYLDAFLAVKKGEVDWLSQLESRLSRYRNTKGSATLSVRDLWLTALDHCFTVGDLADEASADYSGLVSLADDGLAVTKVPMEMSFNTAIISSDEVQVPRILGTETMAPDQRGNFSHLQRLTMPPPRREIPPLLLSVYMLAHDIWCDENDIVQMQESDDGNRPPRVLTGGTRRMLDLFWPSPRWPTYVDRFITVRRWDQLATNAIFILKLEEREPGKWNPHSQRTFDALAYEYLQGTLKMVRREEERPLGDLNLSLKDDDWHKLGHRGIAFLQTNYSEVGARAAVLRDWIKRWPLLATPEAGLSDAAANQLLAGLIENDAKHAGPLLFNFIRTPNNPTELKQQQDHLARLRHVTLLPPQLGNWLKNLSNDQTQLLRQHLEQDQDQMPLYKLLCRAHWKHQRLMHGLEHFAEKERWTRREQVFKHLYDLDARDTGHPWQRLVGPVVEADFDLEKQLVENHKEFIWQYVTPEAPAKKASAKKAPAKKTPATKQHQAKKKASPKKAIRKKAKPKKRASLSRIAADPGKKDKA